MTEYVQLPDDWREQIAIRWQRTLEHTDVSDETETEALDDVTAVVAPVLEAQRQEIQAATEVLDRVREALRQPEDSALSMHAARVMAELDEAVAEVARLRAVVTSALAELRRGGQTNDDRRRAADEILAAASDSGRGSVPATPPDWGSANLEECGDSNCRCARPASSETTPETKDQ